MTLTAFQCAHCGTTVFPPLYFCPSCGGGEWLERALEYGTVSESTVIRHRAGQQAEAVLHLATVVTDDGPVVIARLEQPSADGTRVRLYIDEAQRITARPM